MQQHNPFTTLHEELGPVGRLGRGTHNSVLRAMMPTPSGVLAHVFAVVWDEDHDLRIFPVLEAIYRHDLLWAILFIGERKGGLHVIISAQAARALGNFGVADYRAQLQDCVRPEQDYWPVEVEVYGSEATGITAADAEAIRIYLASIKALWNLGPQWPTLAA